MIVDEAALPPMLATSSQEDTSAQATSEGVPTIALVENPKWETGQAQVFPYGIDVQETLSLEIYQ